MRYRDSRARDLWGSRIIEGWNLGDEVELESERGEAVGGSVGGRAGLDGRSVEVSALSDEMYECGGGERGPAGRSGDPGPLSGSAVKKEEPRLDEIIGDFGDCGGGGGEVRPSLAAASCFISAATAAFTSAGTLIQAKVRSCVTHPPRNNQARISK